MLSVFYLWVSGLLSAVDSMWATVARVTDFFFVYLRSLRNARPPRRVLGKLFSMLMGQTRATMLSVFYLEVSGLLFAVYSARATVARVTERGPSYLEVWACCSCVLYPMEKSLVRDVKTLFGTLFGNPSSDRCLGRCSGLLLRIVVRNVVRILSRLLQCFS